MLAMKDLCSGNQEEESIWNEQQINKEQKKETMKAHRPSSNPDVWRSINQEIRETQSKSNAIMLEASIFMVTGQTNFTTAT